MVYRQGQNQHVNSLKVMCFLFFYILLQEDTDPQVHESLSIENTLWASTVVASGKCIFIEMISQICFSKC